MLPLIERAVLQRLGAVAVVAVLCLGAMMGFPKPAEARVWVGVNFGYPGYYYTLKQDDNIYEFVKDGWNVGIVRKDEPVEGFVGYKLKPRLKDGLLFGVQNVGSGTITYLADDVLFRNFWENGKLMFCNAVFLVGQ